MSVITPFDPWKSSLCTCPPKYSVSAYTGCGHRCLYCYASSYIRNFHSPKPKKDFIGRLMRAAKKLPAGSYIALSNSSDPYMPLERKLRLIPQVLNVLKNFPLKLMIITKSSLIARDRELLREFPRLIISITLTTLEDTLAKRLEPYASSSRERLRALEIFAKEFNIVCRFDPIIYPLNTQEMRRIIKELKNRGVKQIITSTYKAKPDNFKRMCAAFPEHKTIWEKLYGERGERKGRYIYLPHNIRKKLIEEVRTISLQEGLAFSSCREGLAGLNTHSCDGSSFFSV